jgi:all-trans-retinol 13,14-reductase
VNEHVKSYKKETITGQYDVIVIGSGLGGMSTAAFLAKEGKKVLILEGHYEPGGFTHTFKRKGYEWDVGVHYVGEVHRPYSMISKLFDYISDTPIEWAEMGEVYDRMIFGTAIYDYKKGEAEFKQQMKSYFPETADQIAIDNYVKAIKDAQKSQQLFFIEKVLNATMSSLFGKFMRKGAMKYNRPTLKVLHEITKNKKLIAVLTGQYGDYGSPPSEGSFLMHSMLAKHYFNGGCYPVGGSKSIFNAIAPIILKAGGEIFTRAKVKEILVNETYEAYGVELEDNFIVKAPIVISSAGIYNTYKNLLAPKVAAHFKLHEQLNKLKRSTGHMCLYIGLKHKKSELNLGKANYWVFPDNYDHDENISLYLADPKNDFPIAYISFPTAKDANWEERFPDRSTIEIVTVAPWKWFQKWEEERWKKRGAEYDKIKEDFSLRLLEKLYAQEPSLRGKVDHYELSTPLSTKHFCNYEFGEVYGLDNGVERFNQTFLRPRTPVRNLYLTGQDVVSVGIGGALSSGLLTATVVTGKNLMTRLFDSKLQFYGGFLKGLFGLK